MVRWDETFLNVNILAFLGQTGAGEWSVQPYCLHVILESRMHHSAEKVEEQEMMQPEIFLTN